MSEEIINLEVTETEIIPDNGQEEYELTLNNFDGLEEQTSLTDFEERTIYTVASSYEEAMQKFTEYLDSIVTNHGYNGVKPMSYWLFQRIQDGTRI